MCYTLVIIIIIIFYFLIYMEYKLWKSCDLWEKIVNELPNIQTDSLFISLYILLLHKDTTNMGQLFLHLDFWYEKHNQMGNKKHNLTLQIPPKKQRSVYQFPSVSLCYVTSFFSTNKFVSLFVPLSSLHSSTTFSFDQTLYFFFLIGLWEILVQSSFCSCFVSSWNP